MGSTVAVFKMIPQKHVKEVGKMIVMTKDLNLVSVIVFHGTLTDALDSAKAPKEISQ